MRVAIGLPDTLEYLIVLPQLDIHLLIVQPILPVLIPMVPRCRLQMWEDILLTQLVDTVAQITALARLKELRDGDADDTFDPSGTDSVCR